MLINLTAIDTRIDILLFNTPINQSILPAYLPPCLPIYLPACLPTCLPACLPIYLSTYLPIYLSIYLSTYLPVYLSACPPTCLPARLPAYLPIYLPACLFNLSIRSAYSTCLFNPPIQPTSYNKYSRRCYFLTYQLSIYSIFLSNLSIWSAYPICLLICLLNLPT